MQFLRVLYNAYAFFLGRLRAIFWSIFGLKIGRNTYIMKNCMILNPSNIELGSDVCINYGTQLSGHGKLKIGNDVLVGPNCQLMTSNHGYSDLKTPIGKQPLVIGKIIIEDDVWLGANVVVLPDVTIGGGSIVGANAVVTKDVPPMSVVAGVPAKLIKKR
jgi:acetyltransferase-like isoleucine patch superfamily enzyme